MKRLLLPVVAALAFTGCYTRGDIGTGYTYGYASAGPDMYYLQPGVSVVAYSDYPTFYSDNYYWMYSGGLWYRSPYYGSGWVVSYDVPYRVRSINNPHRYTRFQPGRGWTRVSGGSGYRSTYRGPNRGTYVHPGAGRAPYGATATPRGGRPPSSNSRGPYYAPVRRGGGSYNPPARARDNGGVRVTPRGGGATVRDHRRGRR